MVGAGRATSPTDHRVVLVDPPGHGDSERLTRAFTFDECAQCIVDVLDGLGIDRAHFVGNSWGGMIGGTFAATHPDRVGRAVLMNCTASRRGHAAEGRVRGAAPNGQAGSAASGRR